MKIENIHIDGFGVWNDASWGPLDPGLNVFHGPNETGKSTMMAFIRAILFGFDRRGSSRRYEPLRGGNHGGWLELVVNGRTIRVERKSSRHVRGLATVHDGDASGAPGGPGGPGGDDVLERLLGGTTRTLYHNVFAFGLEELEQFHTLQENEVATHISSAGLGIGAARWTSVQKDLEERQSALFLPRGQNSTINVAFKELDAVRDDLDRTEHQPQDYWAAHEAKTRLGVEVEGLEHTLAELGKKVEHYAKRLRSRPLIERRDKIVARLRELPAIDTFPEGGIERLAMLLSQVRNLELDHARKLGEAELRRLRRIELHSLADPEECARRIEVVDSLRSLMPRTDAIRRVYAASLERRDAIAGEKRTLDASLGNTRPPSQGALAIFMALIWIVAGGFYRQGYEYIAAASCILSLAPLLWYRKRRSRTRELEQQSKLCSERLASCLEDIRKTESEARQVEAEIRDLTGHDEIHQADVDARAAEVERLSRLTDEIVRLDEMSVNSGIEIERLVGQIGEARNNLQRLLDEASAVGEDDFLQRAEIYKQRQHLIHELDKIPLESPEPGMLFDMRAEEDAAYETALRELAEIEARLAAARHEAGRVEERIVLMERSEERSRAISKQETILERIDVAAEQWAVLTLCRTLLDETRKIYETERQPEVLRQASAFFNVMSEGRYSRVISPLDGGEIQVERGDGVRLAPQLLSRGTAEQLYLSMRLALIREYARHVEPLPVVFDDIFVNFDPQRSRTSLKAIRELCSTHQVLLFTCHPHLVRIAEEIVPSAKVFPLQ